MNDMGSLRKHLPVTHITFMVACLAISGIPPFAGFFSKEEILLAAWQQNKIIYWLAFVTSGLTAFYMFRLYFRIFWNDGNNVLSKSHNREGGIAMLLPMILLSIGAAAAGFIPFGHFITTDGNPIESHFDLQFSIAPVALGIIGIFTAYWLYKKSNGKPAKIAASLGGWYRLALHKFYIDEIYLFVTKKIIFNLVAKPIAWFDRTVVDGMVNLTGRVTLLLSSGIKQFQSGKVQQYAIYFLAGVIVLAVLAIYSFR